MFIYFGWIYTLRSLQPESMYFCEAALCPLCPKHNIVFFVCFYFQSFSFCSYSFRANRSIFSEPTYGSTCRIFAGTSDGLIRDHRSKDKAVRGKTLGEVRAEVCDYSTGTASSHSSRELIISDLLNLQHRMQAQRLGLTTVSASGIDSRRCIFVFTQTNSFWTADWSQKNVEYTPAWCTSFAAGRW